MKNILKIAGVMVLSWMIVHPSQAQLQQKTIMVGGHIADFGFGLGSKGNFHLNLSPRIGYFVKNNIAVGGLVNWDFNAVSKQPNTYSYRTVVFGRYYIPKAEIYNPINDGRFYAEVQTGFRGVNGTGIGFNVAAGAGYAYFLTPNIAIEAGTLVHATFGTGNNTGIDFNLGFMMHFPTGKLKEELLRVREDLK